MASLQYRLFHRFIILLPMKLRLNVLFFRRFKRFCNFNNPQSFNEKLQYKKLYNRDNLLTVAADKIESKEFIKSLNLDIYIPRSLFVFKNLKEFNTLYNHNLPTDYVIKANHTSQTIRIIRNNNHIKHSTLMKLASSWFKHDQAEVLGEWAYANIPRSIFIEEFLDFGGKEPDDYKFFVYHGKVYYIQLDSDRFSAHKRNMFDSNWHSLNFDYSYPQKVPTPSRPPFLEKMISISESIGSHFDFIRVDLYWYNDMVTFGELTVYPGAGFEKFPNVDLDFAFGRPWVI